MITKGVFEQTVVDLSWSRDGFVLMACSTDGCVAFIEFSAGDLGNVMDSVEVCMPFIDDQ